MPRKIINVVGAAIIKDGEVLCARRGEGKSLAGYWEFPGGKIEPHESARQALHREIEEELLCEIEIGSEVCTASYDYDFGARSANRFVSGITKKRGNPFAPCGLSSFSSGLRR